MIKSTELKYLQDYIKATMDVHEYNDLYRTGGDSLVFEEVKSLIENDMNDYNAASFMGFDYYKLLKVLNKIQIEK